MMHSFFYRDDLGDRIHLFWTRQTLTPGFLPTYEGRAPVFQTHHRIPGIVEMTQKKLNVMWLDMHGGTKLRKDKANYRLD